MRAFPVRSLLFPGGCGVLRARGEASVQLKRGNCQGKLSVAGKQGESCCSYPSELMGQARSYLPTELKVRSICPDNTGLRHLELPGQYQKKGEGSKCLSC